MNPETTKPLSIGLVGAATVFVAGAAIVGSATTAGGSSPVLTPLLIAGAVTAALAVIVFVIGKRPQRAPTTPPFVGYHPQADSIVPQASGPQVRVEEYPTGSTAAQKAAGWIGGVVGATQAARQERATAAAQPTYTSPPVGAVPQPQEFAGEPPQPAGYMPPPAYTRPPVQPVTAQPVTAQPEPQATYDESDDDGEWGEPQPSSSCDDPFGDLL